MRHHRISQLCLRGTAGAFLLAAVSAAAQAPLTDPAQVVWSHAPFEVGECGLCHSGSTPEDPGPVEGEVNELCFGCHEELRETMATAPVRHYAAEDACTNCHNPHNSSLRKLLLSRPPELCADCHSDIWEQATESAVTHGALVTGDSCLNCHNPHASNVQSLLEGLPYDLCVGCHAQSGLQDHTGKELTNFGELLAANPVAHGPVAAKDCTACHQPHGSENFRLLMAEYPAKFYAPFDPDNYRLCFTCHNEEMVAEAETTTLTGFRDGSRNLHFVHVNKPDRGRTCRACHEVHAAPHEHLIRDGVPYGSKGWILPVDYRPTATGGTCVKSCHGPKTYDRTSPASAATEAGGLAP